MRKSVSKIYINAKQDEFLRAPHRIKLFRAGRGTGKTRTLGYAKYMSVARFPRAKSFLSSSTYAQILTKTLPEVQAAWAQFGLKENLHYVVGKRPPKQFVQPIAPPKKFENVISFANGYHIDCLSMDRPDLARGGSYIDGDVDEGLNVKKEALTRVLLPSLRGYRSLYGKQHGYRALRVYSSVPWKPAGYWIMEFDEWQKERPDLYKVVEACTMDNVAVLGLDFIKDLQATLPPLEYQVEVLNKFLKKIPDGFYHAFRAEHHAVADTYDYGLGENGITVEGHTDVNRHQFIDFTVDFGGRFNCGLACQYDANKNQINFLRELYVKDDEGKIRALVNKFCDEYAAHPIKHVRIWGEPMGKSVQADGEPYFVRMQQYFALRGWSSTVHADKSAASHVSRHDLITAMFEEKDRKLPKIRINENTCPNFILVLQITPIKDDFTKDKSREKDPNFPQEHAPHLSDAFDNYITQAFPQFLNMDDHWFLGSGFDFSS